MTATCSGGAFLQDGYLRTCFAIPDEELAGGLAAAAEALGELR